MAIQFNLPQLFYEAFGINGYRPNLNQGESVEITPNVPAFDSSQGVIRSFFDTPVFEIYSIPQGNYKDIDGVERTYGNYRFPYTVVVDISQRKNIVKTPLQGYNGTVKEFISKDDAQLVIRGLVVNQTGRDYPKDDVRRLMNIFDVDKEIEITGSVLRSVFGITHIVIEDISLPRLDATPNVQPFIISAVSDRPFELNLNRL